MKRYKIILTLFWAVMSVLSSVRGQAIVHDPVSMGANVAGFSYQLEEAMAQTNQFFQVIANTEQQLQSLKKLNEITGKISKYVMFMKEVEDVARLAASTIQDISQGVKNLSSGELQPQEISSLLNIYSSSLGQITAVVSSVQQLISDGEQLTTAERIESIERKNNKMMQQALRVQRLNGRISGEIRYRAELSKRIKNAKKSDIPGLLAALPYQAQPADFDEEMVVPDKMDVSVMNMNFVFKDEHFQPNIQESVSAKDAEKVYKGNLTSAANLFYTISAIIAVIGALRVLQTWNQGNDISKPIVAWSGTSLFLVIVGYLIQLFFK